jgi:hypothetical protein
MSEMKIIISDSVDGIEAAHLVCDCGEVDERSAMHYSEGSNESAVFPTAYRHYKATGHALPKIVNEQGEPRK